MDSKIFTKLIFFIVNCLKGDGFIRDFWKYFFRRGCNYQIKFLANFD